MKKSQKSIVQAKLSMSVNDGLYVFSLEALSISSGQHSNSKDAIEEVFSLLRKLTQTVVPNIGALVSPPSASATPVDAPPVPGRKIGTGPGAPVMRKLIEKFGPLPNRQLGLAAGLESENDLTQLSAAATGLGSRSIRITIAKALGEKPSALWPFLSDVVKFKDDDEYLHKLPPTASIEATLAALLAT